MKRMAFVVLAVTVLAVFALFPAGAQDPCNTNNSSNSVVNPTTLTLGTGDAGFYLEVREVLSDEHSFSIWIYQESNGISGLQRGGAGDPCQDIDPGTGQPYDPPDTVIF